jgi:hypothetical protein
VAYFGQPGVKGKSGIDMHEWGEVLLVVGVAQALAKGTAGVEHAGEAERAAAAKSEALAPWTQGETGYKIKTLRDGKREADEPPQEALPRECEYEGPRMGAKRKIQLELPPRHHKGEGRPEGLPELDAMPQGNPNEDDHEPIDHCNHRHTKISCPLWGDKALKVLEENC